MLGHLPFVISIKYFLSWRQQPQTHLPPGTLWPYRVQFLSLFIRCLSFSFSVCGSPLPFRICVSLPLSLRFSLFVSCLIHMFQPRTDSRFGEDSPRANKYTQLMRTHADYESPVVVSLVACSRGSLVQLTATTMGSSVPTCCFVHWKYMHAYTHTLNTLSYIILSSIHCKRQTKTRS